MLYFGDYFIKLKNDVDFFFKINLKIVSDGFLDNDFCLLN